MASVQYIYTQTTHRTTQNEQYIEQHKNFGTRRAVPRLCGLYPGICLTTEKKARKNLSQFLTIIYYTNMTARSKAWVCGRSLARIAGSFPSRGIAVNVIFCLVEVSATCLSLVQWSHTECGVSECYLEISTLRRSCLTRAVAS